MIGLQILCHLKDVNHNLMPRTSPLDLGWDEVEPIRDADKKFPTLSVGGLILTELHFKSNFNRRIKRNETIKTRTVSNPNG